MGDRRASRSNSGDESLGTYLRDIQEVPLLSAEEERALGQIIRETKMDELRRDECLRAQEQMIRANLRLVVAIAKPYANRGLSLADLIAEGNIGLSTAVRKFDPDAGVRFSTYGAWWIKQSIRRALVNTARTVRVPSYMVEMIARLKTVEVRLERELEREPTFDEIAHAMGVEDEGLDLLRRAIRASRGGRAAVSLESMLGESDTLEDPRAAPPDEQLSADHEQMRLQKLLDSIDPREAEVLRLRFGIDIEAPLTLREIGERMGVSRERVRQLETRALRKLSAMMSPDGPDAPGRPS